MDKKKKNKKNKGKPPPPPLPATGKATAGAADGGAPAPHAKGEPATPDENSHVQVQPPGDVDSKRTGVSESEAELDTSKIDGEKQIGAPPRSQIEANFESKIKNLQNEIDSCIQKEFVMEKTIEHLQNECYSFSQKEAAWNLVIEQLKSEINAWSGKEAILKERIKTLERDKDSILEENSTKQVIAKLGSINTGLQKQVTELEQSRDSFVQENKQLLENITVLETRIQRLEEVSYLDSSAMKILKNLTVETKQLNGIGSSVCALVQEHAATNSEVLIKGNEPSHEFDQHNTIAGNSPTIGANIAAEQDGNVIHCGNLLDNLIINDVKLLEYADKDDSQGSLLETIHIDDAIDSVIQSNVIRASDESEDLEILQQPLEEIQIQEVEQSVTQRNVIRAPADIENLEIQEQPLEEIQIQEEGHQGADADDKPTVPLSDAPLVGAPFRLISFFTRYVSGADLVKPTSLNSDR